MSWWHIVSWCLIPAENQVLLEAGDTLMAKEHFEQWKRELAATEISHLHIDYGIFSADLLVQDCNKFQNQSFLRVCVQNQNTLAQLSIQTIMFMDQTFMVHVFWIGVSTLPIILHLGVSPWNILFGFTIVFPTISMVSHQWNYHQDQGQSSCPSLHSCLGISSL